MPDYSPSAGSSSTAGKGSICNQWIEDDAERQGGLERARMCAALTDPPTLPPLGQTPDQKLPENFQSIGSRGTMTMEGKWLMALWTPGMPWFNLDLAPKDLFNPAITDEEKNAARHALFLHELFIQSVLESSGEVTKNDGSDRGGKMGFRTGKRAAIGQCIITGDSLEHLTSDYRIKVFRRDQYVTCRDSCGDVLYHTVKERVDPKGLPNEQRRKSKLTDEQLEGTVKSRMQEIYSHVEWQPYTRKWVIRQEINGHEVGESEEPVTPYFSTPFRLVGGENYGRGFVELNLGDLRSLNSLSEKELQFAAQASKFVPVLDVASEMRPEDLSKPSGEVARGRVVGGVVQDVAFLQTQKGADFNIVFQKSQQLRKDLGTAFLMDAEVIPQKERVTRAQVERLSQELDNATGGAYAPIAEKQQLPLLNRTVYQLNKDLLLPKLPKGVHFNILTGIAALGRANKASQLLSFAQVVAQFPDAISRIDQGVFLEVLARYSNIYEPGLIKSDEQHAKEQQQALAMQAQATAADTAIKTAGKVVETAANAPAAA